MKLTVSAVGRMKSGPETLLADRYFDRLAKTGPALGFAFSGIRESAESRAQTADLRRGEEAARLDSLLGKDARLVLLDERGKNLASGKIAETIARFRDNGCGDLVFAIGGPDGHDQRLRDRADLILSFGAQTWPHQLARILLAEQLFRAVSILSGHPYHRA